jgi:hypothetical protein
MSFAARPGRAIFLAALLLLVPVLTGCGLILGTTVVAVGAVGAAGYTVYKAGEGVVDTVVPGDSEKPAEKPAEPESALAKEATQTFPKAKAKPSTAVVYYHNEFRAQLDCGVEQAYATANSTLPRMAIVINGHALTGAAGEISAQTVEDVPIVLKMQSAGPRSTTLSIRVGANGDLKYSQLIYNLIKDDLGRPAPSAPAAGGQEL